MANNSTDATIALSYLIEDENPRTSTHVLRISLDTYIEELAEAIQANHDRRKGRAIIIVSLFKWNTLMDRVSGDITVSEDSLLQYSNMVSDYWPPDLPNTRGMIHVLVRASTREQRTRSIPASAASLLPSLTSAALTSASLAKRRGLYSSAQAKTVQAITAGPSPSAVARASEFHNQQHRPDAPIHNGRPRDKQGLPLGIYHSIFPKFTRNAKSSSVPDSSDLDEMEELLIAAQNTYPVEADRISAIKDSLETLLDADIILEEIAKWRANGVIKTGRRAVPGLPRAYTVIIEVKNEIGTGDSDPSVQAAESYAHYWSNKPMQSLLNISCCPSFLIAIAGPWMCILGAVFVQKVVVHPLTDFLWMGCESHDADRLCNLTRTFCALRQSIHDLKEYYHSLPKRPDEDLGRFFPYIRQFPAEDNQIVSFTYSELLAVNPVRPVFLAITESGTHIVVKFVRHYNSVAHRALAAEGLAPKLLYDSNEQLECGMRMIIMDYIHTKNLHDYLSQPLQGDRKAAVRSIKKDLTSALRIIHGNGLVFGDLRKPNVLVVENGEQVGALLIDFDWCAEDQTGRYPLGLNQRGIKWADGVKRGGVMDRKHDIGMLELLFREESG
ncbi:hypothetical protein FRC08_012883 [Ceratobasidium sp. 394]|nr:hypothetical protein FRC08_012883 [Ceratobasidium sp. 394]